MSSIILAAPACRTVYLSPNMSKQICNLFSLAMICVFHAHSICTHRCRECSSREIFILREISPFRRPPNPGLGLGLPSYLLILNLAGPFAWAKFVGACICMYYVYTSVCIGRCVYVFKHIKKFASPTSEKQIGEKSNRKLSHC